ncbi:MAG: class I tRNA ligase family protein [Candidatus Sungbacteria bacterium]|nr:class I tRNA ligase family protein [Candidatus Sungbacteria bacterium]
MEALRYNTAISSLMMLLNDFEVEPDAVQKSDCEVFLKLLSPFAPHITEELWQNMMAEEEASFRSIHQERWPVFDEKLIVEERVIVVVQINGVMRDKFEIVRDTSEEEIKKIALTRERIRQ